MALEPGEVGRILHREGLDSSHLTAWGNGRHEGTILGLAPKKRGRRPARHSPGEQRVDQLEAEMARREHHPLLRIEEAGLDRRDAEEPRIEPVEVVHPGAETAGGVQAYGPVEELVDTPRSRSRQPFDDSVSALLEEAP